jgi:glucokinase
MKLLGIDLGGTKILGVLADEHGNVLSEHREPTLAAEGLDAVVDRLVAVIRGLTPDGGVDAIGVDVPAPVDTNKGILYAPPNLPGWSEKGVPLIAILRQKLGWDEQMPMLLINDANASALAEYRFGAGHEKVLGHKVKHMIFLTVSTGIGGGVIVDGKLLLGGNGFAAELGHVVIDAYGYRCNCGNAGCLEAMASGTALAREASTIVAGQRETLIADLAGGDHTKVTAKMVVEAAQQGDPVGLELMEREAVLLSAGVVSFVHAFNPQLIVIGGGVSHAGDLLFTTLRTEVAHRVMAPFRGTYEIVPAVVGDKSAALGSVAAAHELCVMDGRKP